MTVHIAWQTVLQVIGGGMVLAGVIGAVAMLWMFHD